MSHIHFIYCERMNVLINSGFSKVLEHVIKNDGYLYNIEFIAIIYNSKYI